MPGVVIIIIGCGFDFPLERADGRYHNDSLASHERRCECAFDRFGECIGVELDVEMMQVHLADEVGPGEEFFDALRDAVFIGAMYEVTGHRLR